MEIILVVLILVSILGVAVFHSDNKIGKSATCLAVAATLIGITGFLHVFIIPVLTEDKIITNYVNQQVLDEPVFITKVTTYKYPGSLYNENKYYLCNNGLTIEVSVGDRALPRGN